MVRVMASGVFDLIHTGHIHYLQEAKRLGDELVVVVACDQTVRKQKHEPIMSAEERRKLVEALKPVDRAVIGREHDMLGIVEELQPDIIAMGYDQPLEGLAEKLKDRGITVRVVVCGEYNGDMNKTRKIIEKIKRRGELYVREKDRHR
jgi:FAD synthetase